jgi:glutamate carboxypeptidase
LDLIPVSTFEERLPGLLKLLERLVRIESPSVDKQAVDGLVDLVEQEAVRRGAAIERVAQAEVGDQLVARWGHGLGGSLLLVHLDTVHPLGTLERLPWEQRGRQVFGPGVFDMKASLALALDVMEVVCRTQDGPPAPVTLVCTSDEEIGSAASRDLIETQARAHDLVLCLEPALADGALKTRRKGTGLFRLQITGRSAHAGVAPAEGVNAIVEFALQVPHIQALQDETAGTTLTIGTVRGGSRTNVVPERCLAQIDVRIAVPEEAARIEVGLCSLQPLLPGASLEVTGGWNRPPMPRTAAIGRAYERAARIAEQLGFSVGEGATGGASDANFVAPLDVPLLDGLGPTGGGAHSLEEFIWVDSLAPRAALLAALLSREE